MSYHLKLIKYLRKKYIPKRHHIGDCSNICIFIASVLKYGFDIQDIKFVYGQRLGCYHTWIMINNIQYDVSVDCTTIYYVHPNDFVTNDINDDYSFHSSENFLISDFYLNPIISNKKRFHYADDLIKLGFCI